MKAIISIDALLVKTPDNRIWSKTIYCYGFLQRYLDVFESILVVARLKDVAYDVADGYLECSGPNVEFVGMPFIQGTKEAWKYFFSIPKICNVSKKTVFNGDCAVFRLPSISGMFLLHAFQKTKKPYAIEIVVNPNHTSTNACLKLAMKFISWQLKKAALSANGVSYVTKYALQKMYPSKASINGESRKYFESYYSSINLNDSYFTTARDYNKHGKKYRIIHTANHMNNEVKGHKIVIDVVKKLIMWGLDIEVVFLGDGKKRSEFERYARKLEISDYVHFLGILISKEAVRRELLKSDIFLFPSQAEGLPRALIEAMAVGLPCLSTPVDGIPELLPEEYLFSPKDSYGFARKIEYLIHHPAELSEMSKYNVMKAKEFKSDVLKKRRMEFYNKLKDLCEKENIES